jgi:hypothetical protein
MRAHELIAATSALVLWAVAAPPTTPEEDCRLTDIRSVIKNRPGDIGAEWLPRVPDSVYAHMRGRSASDDWLFLVDSVRRDYDAETAPIASADRSAFSHELMALRDELSAVLSLRDAADRRKNAVGVRQIRFRPSIDPNTGAVTLFTGTSNQIVLTSATDQSVRRALCYRAVALDRMLSAYGAPARLDAREKLDEAVSEWNAYGEKSYSQYPWELALNSARFDDKAIHPPRNQIILLHPAVSLELVPQPGGTDGGSSLKDLHRFTSVTIEPVGFISYKTGYEWYLGASLLVSAPQPELPLGAGAMIHLGEVGKLGYVFRSKRGDGRRRDGIVISADLLQLLTSMPKTWQENRDRALSRLPAPVP